jgi:type IV secretory pathway protease TraF
MIFKDLYIGDVFYYLGEKFVKIIDSNYFGDIDFNNVVSLHEPYLMHIHEDAEVTFIK